MSTWWKYVGCVATVGVWFLASCDMSSLPTDSPGDGSNSTDTSLVDSTDTTDVDTTDTTYIDTSDTTHLDTTDTYAAVRVQCVARINAYRATIGLGPLTHWEEKDACTDQQARSDATTGVAHGVFGDCGERAQNECPDYSSTQGVVNNCLEYMWNEGPGTPYSQHGHYINMTNTAYSRVSCGFYATPAGALWAVFNFYE